MRVRWSVVALVAAVVLAVGACNRGDDTSSGGGGAAEGESTVEQGKALKTVSPGKLTVCSFVERPPFAFSEAGEVRGIEVNLMKAVTGRLGVTQEFRHTDRADLFPAIEKGSCDLIASSVVADGRKADGEVSYSKPYFDVRQSLSVRPGDEKLHPDFAALRGKTVGVQSGTTGAVFAAERAPAAGAAVKEFAATEEVFAALTVGQVDAVVHDEPIAAYQAKTTGEVAVARVFEEGEPGKYVFVVPKDDSALLRAVDDALTQIMSDDSYRTILSQYLGNPSGQS